MTGGSIVDTGTQIAEVTDWILGALSDLTKRLTVVLEAGADPKVSSDIRRVVRGAAEVWARKLLNPSDDTAPFVANNIVAIATHGDRPSPEFWRTPLGQLLIGRGGFPRGGAVSRVEAAAVFGVTTERIRRMTVAGDLVASKPGATNVTRESLMLQWRRRHSNQHFRELLKLAQAGNYRAPEGE